MIEWWSEHESALLEDYFTFLRFKSISTDSEYKSDVLACADWVTRYLEGVGLSVDRWETGGHPALFASDLSAGEGRPTLLIYHHYDVQPVDPIELWTSDPFEPVVRDGAVYARGASDNKGQCFYTLCAIKAMMEKGLGFNLKVLIEGEEEIGSPGLNEIAMSKAEALKADYLLMVDVDMPARDQPGVTLGVRGISTMEVEVRNARCDLHSGGHGGIALNPARILCDALASCYGPGGVTIEGFYDDVQPFSGDLDMEFDQAEYEKSYGVRAFAMPEGVSSLEANWLQPTFEINGMESGYTGEGFKTIIPAVAKAKISARLVPNQDPQKVAELIEAHLKKVMPDGVELKCDIHHGGKAAVTSSDSPLAKLMKKAVEIHEKGCKFIMSGGSIPIASVLSEASGADVLFFGTALGSDAIHSPDEHFGIDRLRLGFLSMAQVFKLLADEEV